MNKMIIIATLCCAIFSFAACDEKEVPGYTGDDALYFYKGTYGSINVFQRDSIFYSFLTQGGTKLRDTVYIDIRTMGTPRNNARKISIEQVQTEKSINAIPGVHYVDFKNPEMQELLLIPANATTYKMPLILLRDESLLTQTVNLSIKIVENEDFKIGVDKQASFLVKYSDQLLPSVNWRPGFTGGWASVFGAYGQEKHRFVITYVGFTDYETDVATYPLAVRKFLNNQARKKLADYNAAHPGDELKEANGEKVVFPVL